MCTPISHTNLAMLANTAPPTIAHLLEEKVRLGDKVRALKERGVKGEELDEAVQVYLHAKGKHEEAVEAINAQKRAEDEKWKKIRTGVSTVAKSHFIYAQSASIYGGVGGLFDYGPLGVRMKNNLLEEWRYHFVHEEDMLEVESAALTPEKVLKTSGHVDKFDDFVVKDSETHQAYRADHLLEGHLEKLLEDATLLEEKKHEYEGVFAKADSYSQKELGEILKLYDVRAPETGNELTDPESFNLMFNTPIGPSGRLHGYLRPETAQGIFVNFRKLLEFNNQKMPFAAAQIGLAFRNEIAPRSGLLRVREFQMAEIEHFCSDDAIDVHPKFSSVENIEMRLLPRELQDGSGRVKTITIGDAVRGGTVSKETLGYYMARTQLFLIKMGVDEKKLRFRQHLDTEMAHYAQDCWDAEIRTSYGWIECVGLADRACYDLQRHTDESKVDLVAEVTYDSPKMIEVARPILNNPILGKTFRQKRNVVASHLQELKKDDLLQLQADLEKGPTTITTCEGDFTITPDMIKKIDISEKAIHSHKYTPSVVEPSFGVGRILYSILEHSFWAREGDENRTVLSLSPSIAPVKVAVLPLSNNTKLKERSKKLYNEFVRNRISVKIDESGVAVGRKYSRQDEKGTLYCCTVDFQSLEESTVTIRDRDSMEQTRVPFSDVVDVVRKLSLETLSWSEAIDKYGKFTEATIIH